MQAARLAHAWWHGFAPALLALATLGLRINDAGLGVAGYFGEHWFFAPVLVMVTIAFLALGVHIVRKRPAGD